MSVRDLYPPGTYEALNGAAPADAYASVAQAIAEFRIGKPHWPDRDPGTYDRDAYRKVALIYRCVTLISHAAGVAPVRVYDEVKPDDALPAHPLRRLVRQPNPEMGEAIFWANVALRTAVAGFCVVEKERNRLDEVIGLWPLQSEWLRAVPRANARHDWEYRIPGVRDPYKLPSADVVVFRWTDTPNGSPYGIGPIAIALRSAALITKMVDFLAVLMERGGVPMYGIIPDLMPGQKLDQVVADAMVTRFVQRHGGIANAAVPVILAGIKDVKRLGFDLDELAYTDLRDVSELEIVQAFGVPPTKAMVRVGLEHSDSRANAEVDDATFYRDTMVPLWTRFDDALTTSLLPDFEEPGSTISLEFDRSDVEALQPNRNERAPWLIQGFAGGAFSQHLVHRELGLPVPPTPDYYVRGLAAQAIPATDPLQALEGIPPGDGDGALGRLPRTTIREVAAPRRYRDLRTLSRTQLEQRYAAVADGRKLQARFTGILDRAMRTFFKAQGERVVDAATKTAQLSIIHRNEIGPPRVVGFGDGATPSETYDIAQIDWDDEEALLRAILDKFYASATEAAFKATSDLLGMEINYDGSDPNIAQVLRELGERVVGINDQTRRIVQDVVGEALAEPGGVTLDELAARIREQFGEASKARAMTIARTESMVCLNRANVLSYEETGEVDEVELDDNPSHTDGYNASDGLTCAERHGLIVKLGDVQRHISAEHPNGSLTTIPILRDEAAD